MTRVVLIGAAGRMGRTLAAGLLDGTVPGLTLAGGVDMASKPEQGLDLGVLAGRAPCGISLTSDLPNVLDKGDVFIDFSFHSGIRERVNLLAAAHKAVVIGTTGLDEKELADVKELATHCPILFSANMSLGVNLLASLVEQAASMLKDKGYDIEITEMHHRLKKDAPSGTALLLGEAAAKGVGWKLSEVQKDGRGGITGERPAKEIGFHALRGGDVVGDHTVRFAADGELIDLSHRATRRETFAFGALRAAEWLVNQKPGKLYSMKDVLGIA
jgi:4-hydroxy-tetrahydrodipicolinate reductase